MIRVTNGSMSEIAAAIAASDPGDRVQIPTGDYPDFGAGGGAFAIDKAITVEGAGRGLTNYTLASDASNPFRITGNGAVLKGMTINQAGRPILSISECDGWRVTDLALTDPGGGAHPMLLEIFESDYGVFDNCAFTLYAEQGLIRGKSTAWANPDTMGSAHGIYFEDSTFGGGSGAYLDAHGSSKVVWRFNTIASPFKFDAHGKASNFPYRGVRHIECYENEWTAGAGFYAAMEFRGGTHRVFNNRVPGVVGDVPWFIVQEYYVATGGQHWDDPPPGGYPFDDQIGVGMDPKVAASSPCYHWGNRLGVNPWTWVIGNVSMAGVINNDRDVFQEVSPFNGTGGVKAAGTKADMLALTPTKIGVAWWVTDEGSWNTALPAGTSGQLYVWNGSAWVLNYTPCIYPHPLRSDALAPSFSPARFLLR